MNQIYHVGYDGVHPADFHYDVPDGFPSYLLVITTTPAFFLQNGQEISYPAHTAILYPPRQVIHYGASGQTFGNHWIRFTTDESFVVHFPRQGVPFPISDPEYCRNLFQLLTWETSQLLHSSREYQNTGLITKDPSSFSEAQEDRRCLLNIQQLLRILFEKLHEDVARDALPVCHSYDLLSLRRQITANPQLPWCIESMAKELHISTGYLQLLYRQQFGTSCMEDVICCRLAKARDLLTYTPLSIAEIAEQCGYNNQEHFCRQFRKYTGNAPGQFRKQSQSPD